MSLRLGDIAPDFEQDSSAGTIKFHDWLGDSWGILFSHPADFTPVCTTELGFTAKLKDEFAKRGVKAIALSVDPVDSHHKWIGDINETQNTVVNFPILADADRKVSDLYDLIHPNASDTLTVRSLFVIDPNKKIRLTITYPASTGRNFNEILRVVDSLQLTDNYKVATPANWQDGDEVVIVPSLKDEDEINKRFPKGYRAVKPYLRLTPQPNKYRLQRVAAAAGCDGLRSRPKGLKALRALSQPAAAATGVLLQCHRVLAVSTAFFLPANSYAFKE